MKPPILTLLCASLLFFISCSKSENDYIGDYKTYLVSGVKVNQGASWLKLYEESREVHVLTPLTLSLFVDESDKKLKGQVKIVKIVNQSTLGLPKTTHKKVSLDLKNLRMKEDTLLFTMTSGLLKLAGKEMEGFIIKDGSNVLIGLEKDFVNKNTDKNPYFVKKQGEYNLFSGDHKDHEQLLASFYTSQKEELQKALEDPKTTKMEKVFLESSMKYLKEVLDKKN